MQPSEVLQERFIGGYRLVPIAALIAACTVGGCGLIEGPCGESRGVSLSASADGSDVRNADAGTPFSELWVSENRSKSSFERRMVWLVRANNLRGTATAVHLHLSAGGAPAGLLYDFPLQPVPSKGLVTSGEIIEHQTAVGQWYRGTVSFDDLMLTLYQDLTLLEIHTDSFPEGAFRAPLGTPQSHVPQEDPRVWRGYYCS